MLGASYEASVYAEGCGVVVERLEHGTRRRMEPCMYAIAILVRARPILIKNKKIHPILIMRDESLIRPAKGAAISSVMLAAICSGVELAVQIVGRAFAYR